MCPQSRTKSHRQSPEEGCGRATPCLKRENERPSLSKRALTAPDSLALTAAAVAGIIVIVVRLVQ
jgi:hypothetical protein